MRPPPKPKPSLALLRAANQMYAPLTAQPRKRRDPLAPELKAARPAEVSDDSGQLPAADAEETRR